MKNRKTAGMVCLAILMATTACGNTDKQESTTNLAISSETTSNQDKQEMMTQVNEEINKEIQEEKVEEGIAEAIAMEQNSKEELDKKDEVLVATQASEETDDTLASVSLVMPNKYSLPYEGEKGSVEAITYEAKDYRDGGEGCEKKAFVYLPAGYDESKQYNVLYLMHGIGGSENEWGLGEKTSKLKKILDRLMGEGSVEPFILVTPNGKALAFEHEDATETFYWFGEELRKDLIPYIESHYATYAQYDENGYDMTATRTHRAIAGLSMGGMQTINIGIGECLDLFSWFGAFSAAPTSYPSAKVATIIDTSPYDVDFFYNICGLEDQIAYASASAAAKNLPTVSKKIIDGENFMWQEKTGAHDFGIWYLGIYNFSQLAFNKQN